MEDSVDKIITEMVEHVCDSLCKHPGLCHQQQLDVICNDCKMGGYVLKLTELKNLQDEIDRRTEIEHQAIKLIGECKFEEATLLLKLI